MVSGKAKSKPSKIYSVLIENGSENKTIVFGLSFITSMISFQASGPSSGLGNSSWEKWKGFSSTLGRLATVRDTPGKYSNSLPSPITPEPEQPKII